MAAGAIPHFEVTVQGSFVVVRKSPRIASASPDPYERATSKCRIPSSTAAESRPMDSLLVFEPMIPLQPKPRAVVVVPGLPSPAEGIVTPVP